MPINTHHPEYDKMLPKWKRCRDAMNGQDAVHAAGTDYLPRLENQLDPDYNAYKTRAGFFNATWRAISGLVGMVLRQPPIVDVPASVELMLEDISLSGVPLNSFTQTVLEESLGLGRVGILVDSPAIKAVGVATLADAIAQSIRPTMQLYRAESIINWRMERVNNVMSLTLLVLEEDEEVISDEWTSKCEKRWRELALVGGVYRVRMFKRENDTDVQVGEDVFPIMHGVVMDFIPFQFIGVDDLTADTDEPPLIDLVDINLAHYRVTADYEHGCHFTALPTAVISGYTKTDPAEKLSIGSANAWVFPDPGATATYLEFSGQGLSALTDNLARKEQQMAILGARMLEPQKKGVETADTASIHRKGEESMLASVAQVVSMGIERALTWLTMWAGAGDAAEFDFNHDFYPAPMSSTMLSTIMYAWQAGMPGFSDQEVFAKLQKGEMISEGTTLEEEQARIANRQIELGMQQQAFSAGQDTGAGGAA